MSSDLYQIAKAIGRMEEQIKDLIESVRWNRRLIMLVSIYATSIATLTQSDGLAILLAGFVKAMSRM